MNDDKFLNLLVFLVLMGREHILSKAPSYIQEKVSESGLTFDTTFTSEVGILDENGLTILQKYLEDWRLTETYTKLYNQLLKRNEF